MFLIRVLWTVRTLRRRGLAVWSPLNGKCLASRHINSPGPRGARTTCAGACGRGRFFAVFARVLCARMHGQLLLLFIKGPAQVCDTGLVSTVSRGELLGLWDPQNREIYVGNHPHRPIFRLDDDQFTPSDGVEGSSADNIYLHHNVHIGVIKSGRHDKPYIRKSSLARSRFRFPAGNMGCQSVSQKYSTLLVFTSEIQCNPHVSCRTASLAIIVPTRSPFFEISKSQKSEHDTLCVLSKPH